MGERDTTKGARNGGWGVQEKKLEREKGVVTN